MSRNNYTEAQMIGALKQMEATRRAEDVAREVGVSKHTLYSWKAKYGGMDASQAQEAKQLRDENNRLPEVGGGPVAGQGSVAVGDPKKRLELVAMKAADGHTNVPVVGVCLRLIEENLVSFNQSRLLLLTPNGPPNAAFPVYNLARRGDILVAPRRKK